MEKPRTHYTKTNGLNIAYQVFGDGEIDLVYVPGWVSNIDFMWEDPDLADLLRALGRFCRVILFDKRGTGLSDRDVGFPTLDERMDDLTAVMNAAGSKHAAFFGLSEGGNLALLFAASFPEKTSHLILFGCFARRLWTPDYPWAPKPEAREAWIQKNEVNWGESADVSMLAPSRTNDAAFNERLSTYFRHAASPGAAMKILRLNSEIDVRDILSTISVPTLVMNRRGDVHVKLAEAEYLAQRIPNARLVALPGQDHLAWSEDYSLIIREIELFLTGTQHEVELERVLATILFTDIVNSTELAATMGDKSWRRKLKQHDDIVRSQLSRHRGREINTTGDGFVAAFDAPARAITCASDIAERLSEIDLQVRAGVHTGECYLDGDTLGGIAVHISARVTDLANASEVLVSSTVKDLVVGSGFRFSERGTHQLKGVPDAWTLFAATRSEET